MAWLMRMLRSPNASYSRTFTMLTSKRTFKLLLSSFISITGFTGAHASVIAEPPAVLSTFQFTGNCIDCAQRAERIEIPEYRVNGALVLQNYTAGSSIGVGNFVSFVYEGSNLLESFSVTLNGNDNNTATVADYFFRISGSSLGVITPNASDAIDFLFSNSEGFGYFQLFSNRDWNACAPHATLSYCNTPSDYGNEGTFTGKTGNVPLPGTACLMTLALVGMSAAKRQVNLKASN